MSGLAAVKVAGALAILFLAGRGLVAPLARDTRLYWFERWSLTFLLGTGALSIGWFVLSPLYGVVQPIWLLSAMAVGLLLLPGARTAVRAADRGGPVGAIEILLCALLALEFMAITLAALHLPLGWDGLFNFEMKARLAFENSPQGRLPLAYFADGSRDWSHPAYPLMVPFAEYWLYAWLGRVDQSAIKILFPLFYASLIGLLCGAVRRMTNLRVALVTALAVALLPPLTVQAGASSGYAEVPLAAAMVGAVGFAALAFGSGNSGALALAAALSTVAVWTKAEGLLLAGSLGASALAVAWWQQRFPVRKVTVLVWMPLLVAVPWLVFQQRYGMPARDFLSLSPGVLVANLPRVPTIVSLMARELARPGHWGSIWPVAVAALVLMIAAGRKDARDWLLAGAFLLPLALYVPVFVFSAWSDIAGHMGTSFPRLLIPLVPIALMFTVRRLSDVLGADG